LKRWLVWTALGAGLAITGLAVCSATVWRPPDHVSAVHRAGSAASVVVAEPGVMEAQADTVEISVQADVPVVVAIGRDADVTAWVADSPAEHLTGFSNRQVFTVRESGSDEPLPPAADSDLWTVVREYPPDDDPFRWVRAEEGRWSLVVAPGGDGAGGLKGLELTMTWPQAVVTPWVWPGGVLGVALMAAAGTMALASRLSAGAEDALPDAARRAAVAAPEAGLERGPAPGGEPGDQATAGQDAPPRPKARRRWFRGRAAPPAEPPAAVEPAPPEPPKLDLGLATPNRNWERLAAPDPRYADLEGDDLPVGLELSGRELSVLEPSGQPVGAGSGGPGAGPGAARPLAPSVPGEARVPAASGASPAPSAPPSSRAPFAPAARSEGVPPRVRPGPPSGGWPPARPIQAPTGGAAQVTADQKIAALRRTHTSLADDAAATIAAAVAAAAGDGSAAGLTRRQIREAERAAGEALRASGRAAGQIPPWRDQGARPAVQMQSSSKDEG
jgi:hypothetical protein